MNEFYRMEIISQFTILNNINLHFKVTGPHCLALAGLELTL